MKNGCYFLIKLLIDFNNETRRPRTSLCGKVFKHNISITLLFMGKFRFDIWPLHFSQLPSNILWPVGSYGLDSGLEFDLLDIYTSQDSGSYSATRESMLSQK